MSRGKLIALLLTASFFYAAAPVALAQVKEPRLLEALADIKRRDAETHERIAQALQEGGDSAAEAKELLREHADYLERLKNASPKIRALLLNQEAKELEVRGAVEAWERAMVQHEEKNAREAKGRVLSKLSEWFDIRHDLREHELRALEEGAGQLEQSLEAIERGDEEAHAHWIKELTEGGSEHMGERLEHLRREEEHLNGLVEELEQAEQEEAKHRLEEVLPQRQFIHLQLTACNLIAPKINQKGELDLDTRERETLEGLVREIIERDIQITHRELEKLRLEIDHGRRHLERRAGLKDVIVGIKLAEITGERDLYDW
ncbi:MAG: hypothetical protein CMJ83_16245 [Planctomycetes bacterium]|nr:hypothetical protein [Planctomycetota bacterium]